MNDRILLFLCWTREREGEKKQKNIKTNHKEKEKLQIIFLNQIHIARSASCYLHIVLKTLLNSKEISKYQRQKLKNNHEENANTVLWAENEVNYISIEPSHTF